MESSCYYLRFYCSGQSRNNNINFHIIDEDDIVEIYEVVELFDGDSVEHSQEVSKEERQQRSAAEMPSSRGEISFVLDKHEPKESCMRSVVVSNLEMIWADKRDNNLAEDVPDSLAIGDIHQKVLDPSGVSVCRRIS